jgi:hypothetical protein
MSSPTQNEGHTEASQQQLVPVESPIHAKARSIMGRSFLGLPEVQQGFGRTLDPTLYARIPFSEATLRTCSKTHILLAGQALTLNQLRVLVDAVWEEPEEDEGETYDAGCYQEAFAAATKMEARWYLLSKEANKRMLNKTYKRQRACLPSNSDVPLVSEVAYMIFLYWRIHGEPLYSDVSVRCQDEASLGEDEDVADGLRATIRFCPDENLVDIGLVDDHEELTDAEGPLGLASALQPEAECLT